MNLAPTTLTAAAASGTFGGTAALSATLTRTADGPISGKTIAFTLNGTSVGSATTNASGVASIAAASLTGINAGSYPTGVGASFASDGSFAGSTGTAALTVTPATVTVTVTVIPTSIAFGALVELDADLSPGLSGRTISYSIDGTPVGTDVTNGSGKSKLMNVNPASFGIGAGSHTVTATFPAEQNFATASGTGSLTITQAATTTAVTSSLNPSSFGQPVTFTATVTSAGGTPAGSATFIEGGTCAAPDHDAPGGHGARRHGQGHPHDQHPRGRLAHGGRVLPRQRQLRRQHGQRGPDGEQGDADGHLGQPGRHHLRDRAERDPAQRDRLGARQLRLHPGRGHGAAAGNGQTLSVSFTPTDATNYNSVPSTTVTINVLKLSLTPHVTANNKPYDGTDAATLATRTVTVVFGTDDVTLTGGTATFDTKQAGTGKTVTVTGLTLGGTRCRELPAELDHRHHDGGHRAARARGDRDRREQGV